MSPILQTCIFQLSTFITIFGLILSLYPPLAETQIRGPPWELNTNGSKLLLTPYINSGRLDEGVRLSRVTLPETFVESYSGFLTVNSKYNGNLFFWFFPAANNPSTAPVLLWLNGGPGAASLFGLFDEMGPFTVTQYNTLVQRPNAWTESHSIVYIDSPVGAGFSFTDEGGYAKTDEEVGRDLYIALTQFFTLFRKYASLDFYLTGESYAGKYLPALAVKIHTENKRSPKVKINMKGLLIGNPFTEALTTNYGLFLYTVGLIDEKELNHFQQEQDAAKAAAKQGQWERAYDITDSLIIGQLFKPTYFTNVTGYTYKYNILYTTTPAEFDYYLKYLQKSYVRRGIHVGSQEYVSISKPVRLSIKGDIMKSGVPQIVQLLEAPEKYKILFFSGNLDITVPTVATEEMLLQMRWSGSKTYMDAPKKEWFIGKDIAGYVKKAKNLTFLIIRNAGHIVPYDQLKPSRVMIDTFTSGREFA